MALERRNIDHLHLVIAWFTHQKASSVPEPLAEALRNYLARLPAAERKRVIPKEKRKQPCDDTTSENHDNETLSHFERAALKYMRDKQIARGGTGLDDSRILRMMNALACWNEPKLSKEGFCGLLSSSSQGHAIVHNNNDASQNLVPTSWLGANDSPLSRLSKLYQQVEVSAHLHALALRILKILIHHQFKLLKATGIDAEAQEREMLRRTGFTLEKSKDVRARANGWLRFISVLGFGALGVVQGQADDDFEKRATLPFLRDCRDFFDEIYPQRRKQMTDVNKLVGDMFLQVNTEYARDGKTLLEGSGKLSMYLREAFGGTENIVLSSSISEAPGLEQLAELARSRQPLDVGGRYASGQIPSSGYADNEPYMEGDHTSPVLPQTRSQDANPEDVADQAPLWHGDARVSTCTSQQAEPGQAMQTQWCPFPKQIWPPQTADFEPVQATTAGSTANPAQDHANGRDIDIWDEFIVEDFAGSLHYLQS